jgi:hypothetical protein
MEHRVRAERSFDGKENVMATGHPISALRLTGDEREALERWARRPTTAQALAQRARDLGVRERPHEHPSRARTAN